MDSAIRVVPIAILALAVLLLCRSPVASQGATQDSRQVE